MRKYSNWDHVKALPEYQALPAGGYICRIMGAEVKAFNRRDGGSFEQLQISLDIAEGEYKDHYAQEYRAQNTEDKRWKGVLRLYLPDESGTDQDNFTASRLKAAIEAIEDSNSGYHWDWDERKLKGKLVGCLFRLEEWSFDGRTGWKTQPFKLLSAARIREGKFQIPKDKPLKDSRQPAKVSGTDSFLENGGEIVSDNDLPF